jgi:TRAP-type C4-dicarboxylate transport system substrate-binding protein
MKLTLTKIKSALFASVVAAGSFSLPAMAEDINLKASHQWPGGKGDIRDEMVQMIARHMEEKKTGVNIKVYPGKSLFKPKEQWDHDQG